MKALWLLLALSLQAQAPPVRAPPELEAQLSRHMKRGQELFEYERLAWVATDLLMEKKPDLSRLGLWVEMPIQNRRYIFFGRFKKAGDPKEQPDGFAVAYGFWAPLGKPDEVHEMDLQRDIPSILEALKALPDLADAAALAKAFPSPLQRAWNYSVFREADGTITAYLLPANSDPTIIPIGSDFRLSISSDGKKILNSVALHQSFLQLPLQKQGAGGFHTHTLQEDLPPETDLAVLKLYPGGTPHYFVTRKGLFSFDGTGLIFLGRTEDVLK